ncbi:MAG TPA: ATP-binding protein [Candidatus Blautia excrementigallinarum]|nr:ATP-binding protein [Candidatus Blautia excrementigallinarum]
MSMFLNCFTVYDRYRAVLNSPYFVDKTLLLEELIPLLCQEQRFVCITRPRRFGKTVMANMIGAFFQKGADSCDIFDNLLIAGKEDYKNHLNRHNVIFIDFSEMPENCSSYSQYISRILSGLKQDLSNAFPELDIDKEKSVWDILTAVFEKNGQKFIFIMDEWDAVFHMSFITEDNRKEYLQFLKLLLKSKSYVELAYITGILPIAKYSSGSELNMFQEYDMATKIRYSEYFGFLDSEIDMLYERYTKNTVNPRITRQELKEWYDGYHTASGERLYNPRSVVCALSDGQLASYWTSSGPYDEIFYYIRNDLEHIRDDLALMVCGESVDARIGEFAAFSMDLKTKNQIYSAMVVYGLLTYDDGRVLIPNRELMLKYDELLQTEDSLGYVYRLAARSEQMLKATFAGDTDTMAEVLEYVHDTEIPVLSYNHETELAAVVNLVYLAARDRYRVEREDKAGKGFVDFIFYPLRRNDPCMILELKVDHTPEEAIHQIKEKKYISRFSGKLGELPQYTGRILAVGIGYKKKTKQHLCAVEELQRSV